MDAAPPGKRVRWYDTGHELSRAVFSDQDRWLEQVLGLPSGRRSPGST